MFAAGPTGETAVRDGKRQGEKRYRLLLYVDDVAQTKPIVEAYSEAIRSRTRLLGLRLGSIWVRKAPPLLAGKHAFKRTGTSEPLRDEALRGGSAE